MRLIKNDFNKNYLQVFISTFPLQWPQLATLTRKFKIVNLIPESVEIPRHLCKTGKQSMGTGGPAPAEALEGKISNQISK